MEGASMSGEGDEPPVPRPGPAGADDGGLEPGANPGAFAARPGLEVLVRVTTSNMGSHETVRGHAVLDEEVGPPGRVYRVRIDGDRGDHVRVMIDCHFPVEHDPPGEYQFSVQSTSGGPVHDVPPILQPGVGAFPQSLTRTITFAVIG